MSSNATYQGAYSQFVNSIRNNMPNWMKKRIPMGLMVVYDNIFKPVMQEIFPKIPGPRMGGEIISVNTPFQVPYTADLGMMAPLMDKNERVPEYTSAFGRTVFQAKLAKMAGPTIDPLEFKNEFEDGFIDARNQQEISNASRAIARRVEYELTNYVFGNPTAIAQFSNQSTERLMSLNADYGSGTYHTYGTAWSNLASSDPLYDITYLNMLESEFVGEEFKSAYVGNKTAWCLDNNQLVARYEQYHLDVTQTLIGKSLKGVQFHKVLGQTYKENASLNSAQINYPGRGDYRPDTWTDRNKIPMMRHAASGNIYEWALFATDDVGNTVTARTNEKQSDSNIPFPHSWKNDELGQIFSTIQFGFTPAVKDFARVMVLKKVCQVS